MTRTRFQADPITSSPIDPDTIRRHARVDDPSEVELAVGYSVVAAGLVEQHLSRMIVARTAVWTIARDDASIRANGHQGWGPSYGMSWQQVMSQRILNLPRPDVTDVASVSIGTWGMPDSVLAEGTDYDLDLETDPARVKFAGWPGTWGWTHDHVQVSFTAGYAPGAMPPGVVHAILLLTTRLYEQRGDEGGELFSPAVESLLANYRHTSFGAL